MLWRRGRLVCNIWVVVNARGDHAKFEASTPLSEYFCKSFQIKSIKDDRRPFH